jgi:ribonuclease HI
MDELKEKLTTAPILAHPDYTKPVIVHTDASTTGLGVVLSQKDNGQKEYPIVYLSRTLSPAEKNYSSTEMECLAIIWALKKLHPYLDGSTCEIITDHSALQWILNFSGTI